MFAETWIFFRKIKFKTGGRFSGVKIGLNEKIKKWKKLLTITNFKLKN